MAADDVVEMSDRRGLDRRMEMAERDLRQMETQMAVMKATLDGLVSTMDSRHKAFERGQDLILKGIDTLEKAQIKLESEAKAPQDLSRIVFSPGVVLTIIGMILSIVAGQQAATWGMRSDIRDISTRQAMQEKVQEDRAMALKGAVDAVGRKQELFQLQIQDLQKGK
jgi:hypothetical protein